jgi:hypothetical protein
VAFSAGGDGGHSKHLLKPKRHSKHLLKPKRRE